MGRSRRFRSALAIGTLAAGSAQVAAADLDASEKPIAGTVVDERTREPLANRLVVVSPGLPRDLEVRVDGTRTTTDGAGRFFVTPPASIADGPRVYDVAIVEPDRSAVSLYHHVTSAAPRLVHRRRADARGALDTAFLTAPEPPRLQAFARQPLPTDDIELSWTPFRNGVHLVRLEGDASDLPAVDIYTAAASVVVPSLGSLGVDFPRLGAVYEVHVEGLGPYPSIDRAVGRDGVAAREPALRVSSEAITAEIKAPAQARVAQAAAARAAEAARRADEAAAVKRFGPRCDRPEEQTQIWCGPPRPDLCRHTLIPCPPEGLREWYILPAINRKLRFFPEFANAIGMHCVHDCAGARAFMKAYGEYMTKHPGFDAVTPMEFWEEWAAEMRISE